MGPRLFRRGDVLVHRDEIIVPQTLQWGHAFSGVETARKSRNVAPVSSALQWGHAFSGVETARPVAAGDLQHVASMGPRLFRRGDNSGISQFQSSITGLQWGHAFSGVETWPRMAARTATPTGFNGATPFQAWRLPRFGSRLARSRRFNGATPFQAWRHAIRRPQLHADPASMGPRLFRRGDALYSNSGAQAGTLQWGHAFSGVETCRIG